MRKILLTVLIMVAFLFPVMSTLSATTPHLYKPPPYQQDSSAPVILAGPIFFSEEIDDSNMTGAPEILFPSGATTVWCTFWLDGSTSSAPGVWRYRGPEDADWQVMEFENWYVFSIVDDIVAFPYEAPQGLAAGRYDFEGYSGPDLIVYGSFVANPHVVDFLDWEASLYGEYEGLGDLLDNAASEYIFATWNILYDEGSEQFVIPLLDTNTLRWHLIVTGPCDLADVGIELDDPWTDAIFDDLTILPAEAVLEYRSPDMVVAEVWVGQDSELESPPGGHESYDPYFVTLLVANIGGYSWEPMTLTGRFEGYDGDFSVALPPMPPSQFDSIPVWLGPEIPTGDQNVVLTLDPEDLIEETNEANNEVWYGLYFEPEAISYNRADVLATYRRRAGITVRIHSDITGCPNTTLVDKVTVAYFKKWYAASTTATITGGSGCKAGDAALVTAFNTLTSSKKNKVGEMLLFGHNNGGSYAFGGDTETRHLKSSFPDYFDKGSTISIWECGWDFKATTTNELKAVGKKLLGTKGGKVEGFDSAVVYGHTWFWHDPYIYAKDATSNVSVTAW